MTRRIAWRSLLTGHCSHGRPLPRALAETWLDYLSGNPVPYIEHWLEAC